VQRSCFARWGCEIWDSLRGFILYDVLLAQYTTRLHLVHLPEAGLFTLQCLRLQQPQRCSVMPNSTATASAAILGPDQRVCHRGENLSLSIIHSSVRAARCMPRNRKADTTCRQRVCESHGSLADIRLLFWTASSYTAGVYLLWLGCLSSKKMRRKCGWTITGRPSDIKQTVLAIKRQESPSECQICPPTVRTG
jgi:hypothetical protein